ncbi:LamG-like jellyroll fold domain-containing protein [Streptomyces sp. MUM 178J]|uniref:LamG-like jellyroll fold domain-containing protein n=1 Tax=Streptomyces sp. MUM 178J TaxID=2791991 RepID=UPI001F0442D9|nr:LamG-like jellyroll fold domain-containing protein [Streptomyces sp. MUM 178J]WRQ82724.1 LamG-like jellyroll fold domain-containing protein [Streptomyces sp. MUM 178J]
MTAVTALISLSLLVSTEQAVAQGATLPSLSMPKLSLSGLWQWMNTSPLDTPDQKGGSAKGKSHKASADDTSADGGVGRKPGKGKGELDPYKRPVDKVEKTKTGKAPGDADSFDPKSSKRDAKKSTATSDYFVNADGSTTVKHYASPANFKADDGTWKPIDTTLVEDKDGRLGQRANSLDVEFAPDAADQRLASVDFGDGLSLAYSLRGTAKAEPELDDQKIVTYPGVLPDTDLRLVPLAEGFKEHLVLHSPDAPNSWLFPMELKGLTPRLTDDGDVEFTARKGEKDEVVATIPHAFMEDSKIDPRSGDATRSQAVTYELVEEDGKPALRMTADEEWLKDPERVYPVTVDPTIAASNSTYVQSNYSADRSTEKVIKVGSYDSGANAAISFLQFSSLSTTLKGQRVSSAKLNVYASWSSTCTPQVFYAQPVTESWSPSTTKTFPGPKFGPAIGSATPNPGASCTNTSASTSVGVKMPVTLDTGWFDWVATGGANYGLALTAPVNDNLHWKKFHSDNSTTSGFRPALELTYAPNTKPQITAQYPPVNFQANTLRPELLVYAHDSDKWPAALSYTFEVYDADSGSTTPVATSGSLSRGAWRVPADKLKWSKNYVWYVGVSDGYAETVQSGRFTTAVPQPPVTSGLAQNTGGHEFDPSDGNYTTEDTDAQVSVVGPSLEIDRSYNSLDPRLDNAFGAGWSTVVDMKAAEHKDPSGTVTHVEITYPGGEQVAFGRNSDGTFVPPLGRYARIQTVTGGYTLTDKDFTEYRFTQAVPGKTDTYAISSIKDFAGRTETFTYTSGNLTKITNETSKRSLHLTWTTPAGATAAHVATVATDPATSGDATTAQTWTYGYAGDQLTKVCTPADPLKCTTYGYTTGNHYRTTVLDADPFAYWRLGETAGETVAKDSIVTNQGKYNGLFHDVALGAAGPLAGSTQTAASFNGTTSYVEMPSAPGATPSYMSVSLWFKTTTAGGVLFYYGTHPLSDPDPVNNTKYNTPAVYVGTDGKLRGCLAMSPGCSPNIVSGPTVTDGKWHQAVLTGQANSQTLYLDGAKVGSLTGTINDWDQPYISLGAGVNNQGWPAMNPDDKLGHYTGDLAEVAVYSEPLTPAVITAQYQAAKNAAGLLNRITTPEGKVRSEVDYGTADDLVLQATDANGGTWKLNPPTVTGSSQVYRSAVMGSAPAGYWRLDDTAAAPQAANQVNTGFGTYNTATQGVTGPFGAGDATAASFDGVSSYAEIPFAPWHGSGERAVELWFKTGSPGVILSDQSKDPTLASPSGSWNPVLYAGSDGKLHGHWWSVSGSGSTAFGSTKTVTDDKWHHAVLSASGTKQTLYLDGVKQGEYSGAAKDQSNTRTFVGAGFAKYWYQSPGDVSFFNGSIAEVAAYGHPLSAADVEAHWKAYKSSSGVAPVKTVKLTDPTDKTLTYVYDAEMGNRLLAAIDTKGKRTTYGYDTGGFLHTVTDANGNRSINGHDVRGNTVSTTTCQDTAADKCSTEYYTYFPDATTAFPPMDLRNDLLLTERDGRSSGPADDRYLTTYTYDTAGKLTSVTTPPVAGHPDGRTATTTYTTSSTPAAEGGTATVPAGLLDTVTTPGGKKTRQVYHANGDLAEVTDANGARVTYAYDNLGRQLSKTEYSDGTPAGLTTTFTYDKNDQVVTETGPEVTNRVTGAVHQARTTTGYDADGNVLSQTVSDLTGGDAARTVSMTYDAWGRMDSRTDAGGDTTSFTYDVYGNKVEETDPDGTAMTFTYDAEGRALTTNVLDFVGDPNNPSAPSTLVTESRAYDPAGRLASLTDAMGWRTEYTYTDDGLSASVVRKDPQTGESFTEQANTYDAAGNLIKQVTNDGQTTNTFTVDASDRVISSVLDPGGLGRTTTVSYDPDDNVVTESEYDPATGEKSTLDRLYDNLGNVTGTTVHDGTVAPVARYKLDETTGYDVGDSSGANHTATHGTGMHWNTDRGGSAVFDGDAESYAQTDGPVVNTSGSFTVSTWAKLTDTSVNHTLVSQDGEQVYRLVLYYSTAGGWSFGGRAADSKSAPLVRAYSGTDAVTANTWTHLTGVYDAEAAKIRLYVNGSLEMETAWTSPWEAKGPLQLGRHKYGTGYNNNHKGGLDDVQVYGEALTGSQVSSLYGGTLPAAGSSVQSTTWKLDQRGLPVSMTDPNGITTDYGYDEGGQQTTVTEPAVNAEQEGGTPVTVRPVTMIGYNTFGERTEVSDPLGNVSVTTYDAEGQETSVKLPNYTPPGSATPIEAMAWTEYNSLGQVTAEVDPLGNRTTYAYTQLGAVASVTEPGGATTKYAYADSGEQLSVTRPNGAREEMTWDYLGRPLTSTTVVRQPTQRAYTAINEYDAPGGELSRSVSPTGVAQSYTYNAVGEVTEVTDAAGQTTKATYNIDGGILTATEPDGTSTKVDYDGFGRPVATHDLAADGTVIRTARTTYDRAGNPVEATDYRGHTTKLTLDPTGLVTKAVQPVSETESITTTFGYDVGGNRTRFTDGRGNKFLTTYNSWGLPESLIEPSTPNHPDLADRTFTTVYDKNGRVAEQRSPGNVVISNVYDAKSRLVRQTGTGAEAETVDHTYAYDSDDRLVGVAGVGEETNTFTYDDRGLLLSTTGPSGASSFAYNGDGAMTSRTDASGTSTFGYDTAGRLKTVNDGATGSTATYGYDVNSNVTSIDYGTGKAKRSFGYDALQRLTSDKLTAPSGTVTSQITYGYDKNSNETSKTTVGVAGASTNTYTYDWANRITSWNNGTSTEVYGYDASGNRTRVGGDTYTYDERNRLTSDGHSTYSYTPRGTMSSVVDEGGVVTQVKADAFNRVINEGDRTYQYDGLDRLLSATTTGGGSLYDFQYSGMGNDVASDGAASYSRNVDGTLLGVKTPVSSALYLTDLHTDVVAQFTDTGETLTGSATYTPFGKVVQSTGMVGNLGYQSGWTDPATAKVNMAARWYSPETGQFNSRDTVGLSPLPTSVRANRYAYADQNPMTMTDPTGHWSIGGFIKKAANKVKKVAKKVKKTVKSAYKKTKKAVKKVAKRVRKAAKKIKKAVKRVVKRAKRAVRKTVRYVKDSVKKVKRYVKRTYKKVKKYAHKVVKKVKKTVRKVAKAAKSVARKVVKAARKVGRAVKKAAKATVNYVKKHAATIAAIGVGIAVFAGCTALTAGVGAIGCAALAGAAANGVGYMMSDGPKSVGGFLGAVVVGAATGAIGGAIGGAVSGAASQAVGRLLSNVGSRVVQGAAREAAGGAAEGAVEYGVSCATSPQGCSAAGAATATALGAATGGVFGAAGSRLGPKSKPNAQTSSSSPRQSATCPVRTPHSFTGKTGVLMADGTTEPISEVKAGDYVLTAEPGKKKKEKHKVKKVIVTLDDRDYVDVVVATKSGPKTIQTTKHHQFYEATRNSWTQATDLKAGQKLQNAEGGRSSIVEVTSYTAERITYDLSVEGLHTYHVLAGAEGVLVHNCGGSNPAHSATCTCAAGGQPRLLNGTMGSNPNAPVNRLDRSNQYPSGYRASTHQEMERRWTDSSGNWLDEQGSIIPRNELTYDHAPPVVDHWNTTGFNTSRAARNDYFNDPDNLVPMRRGPNSAAGGRMTARYRQDTGPNYSP